MTDIMEVFNSTAFPLLTGRRTWNEEYDHRFHMQRRRWVLHGSPPVLQAGRGGDAPIAATEGRRCRPVELPQLRIQSGGLSTKADEVGSSSTSLHIG